MRNTFGRWMSFALVAIILLGIWKINNGNLTTLADSVWGLLNKGADVVVSIWNSFTSIGK